MATDPEQWVFPPRGVSVPPFAVTGAIGPIRRGDTIVLEWDPPIQTVATLACQLPNGSVPHWDSQVEVPPFLWTATLTFNETPVICHHALIGTKNGNTITWRYLNDPSDPPTTWARSTSTSSRGSTGTPAPSSTVLSSGQPTSNPAMSSNGLSVGTGVGIGVGAVICLILILSLTVWLFLRKHRKGQVLGESLMHSSVPYKPELEVSNATAAKLQQPLPASEESARLESGHDLGIPEAPASQINELENIQRSELMG